MTPQQPGTDQTPLPPGMHPAMVQPEPPAEPSGRREGLLVAVAAVVGAMAVLAGLIGFQQWRSDDGEVAAGAAETEVDANEEDQDSSDPAPSSTVPDVDDPDEADAEPADQAESEDTTGDEDNSEDLGFEPVACPTEYDQVICDAAAFVQRERERPFKEFPVVELLDDAEFDAALLTDFAEYEEELVEDERVLKALGLIPTSIDLVEAFRALLEAGVLGFYDPEIKRLVVRGGEFDLFGQSILVHELVHAFDDQWFDLNRPDYENDDQEYAFSAVVEGNASRVEETWRNELSIEDKAALQAQEFSSLSPEDLNQIRMLPGVILQLQASPYIDGQRYVDRLHEVGGEKAVDDSLAVAPRSSEEILHEGNLFEEELAIVDVATPTPDGQTLSEGRLGELMLQLWLDENAATGWGGDRYVVWDNGAQTCLTVDLAADTPTDLLEMETSAAQWQAALPDLRTVTTISTADRTLVRAVGCY